MTDTSQHFGAACCSYKSVSFDGNWKRLKRVMNLEFVGRNKTWLISGRTEGTFVYMTNCLVVEFHNDPETGVYHFKSDRPEELGYASYIGAYGSPSQIRRLNRAIKCFSTFIKSRDETERTLA
jgi:hypothetical protein